MNQERMKELFLKLECIQEVEPREFGYINGRIDAGFEILKKEIAKISKTKSLNDEKGA
ncbi:hypothetical protein Semix9P1_phi55 [Clostridioides phage phiSemix9P1]|uniref:hypothetical protein n=1 Tax=unclassified Clostridioides TaxID=2635829 RepID=UPI0009C24513|nr:hypothetical protein Semix9P1_phi55 [Clostridioides phage phiSemix9P1]MCC0646150.1 hypothetical protein [Clostridioides sp. ZZV14-6150]MCC0718341.1 hypothetical protein [Clostridioides sp. ZZV14-6105]MCC0723968.1 hypothetical protein [Clostridioides sp. ZZV14-6104]MCC0724828.1 hypothetical protein [Clostridioides sp. ZZV14-6045]MCC0732274.1 hypothetical protein [Clostridioides sp. ZZV14-6048]MCC0736411.1 hypothetical protein [Clostridioides sp. ZZV14-6009]MCC0740202.1 hypothetical protein